MNAADVRAEALREAAAAVLARQDAVDADLAAKGVLPPIMGRVIAADFARTLTALAAGAPSVSVGDRTAQEYGYADEAALDAAVAAAAAESARDARFDTLVRRDLALACTLLRMRLAAIACASATPSVWFSMSLDVGGIRIDANMRATRNAVEQAAGAMARSRPDLAAQHLADLCGLSVEAWAEQVDAEARAEADTWAAAEVQS